VTPRTRELLADALTPVSAYRRLAAAFGGDRFLFESVTGGESVSRFSFLGAGSSVRLRLFSDRLEVERDGRRGVEGEPLGALGRWLDRSRAAPGPFPFMGGWVAAFEYDLVRLLERLPSPRPAEAERPVATLARFDAIAAFDHARQRVVAVSNEIEGEVSSATAEARLDAMVEALSRPGSTRGVALPATWSSAPAGTRFSGAAFRRAVATAKEHIAAGDIFQVVLARRWTLAPRLPEPAIAPLDFYRALRLVNPSPYMVLLELDGTALVGASPEMLVKVEGRRVATRPIAGTRRRGATPAEDERLAAELLGDEKERAEHVMLVDLGRNDVGRVAAPGTVAVREFSRLERYSHVMHLVSSVEGELAPGRSALDALLACFPAGTVSGAPKVRAMEILDRLEPEGRGPYAGAVGYVSFSGDLDTCITIRTLVMRDGEVAVTAGAGIVADSDPAAEERETESKAAALLAAAGLATALRSDR
jgi:anthranilate synthase component 1